MGHHLVLLIMKCNEHISGMEISPLWKPQSSPLAPRRFLCAELIQGKVWPRFRAARALRYKGTNPAMFTTFRENRYNLCNVMVMYCIALHCMCSLLHCLAFVCVFVHCTYLYGIALYCVLPRCIVFI